ncbi:MAG: hypothetical protein PUB34_06515 [Clostridia bacterium]|nr:hypothetical protein [Clostridia bacterium]
MLPEEQAELDRLSDRFFAGMRKVAEYNFEGVDGETRKMKKSENDNENDNKNDFGEKKKNIAKKKKAVIMNIILWV